MKTFDVPEPGRTPPVDAPRPLWIGPRNAEAVTGQRWRWCRDHARVWGVPVLRVDAKPLIPADAFRLALEAHAEAEREDAPADDATELEAMRRRFGKQRRTVSPQRKPEDNAEPASSPVRLPHPMPRGAA